VSINVIGLGMRAGEDWLFRGLDLVARPGEICGARHKAPDQPGSWQAGGAGPGVLADTERATIPRNHGSAW
jgi:hypothetical protein